ncbi:1563_t:CDS:2 [Paraglomus occultum]|uniref:1563_t:CDS:1 n=1 Tax=Paraglomus occultum TaxID=144539 RepID=A0A9N9BUJ6_9GLOM|nr:1563_t:CDS:2 [Paraglomus occultum]
MFKRGINVPDKYQERALARRRGAGSHQTLARNFQITVSKDTNSADSHATYENYSSYEDSQPIPTKPNSHINSNNDRDVENGKNNKPLFFRVSDTSSHSSIIEDILRSSNSPVTRSDSKAAGTQKNYQLSYSRRDLTVITPRSRMSSNTSTPAKVSTYTPSLPSKSKNTGHKRVVTINSSEDEYIAPLTESLRKDIGKGRGRGKSSEEKDNRKSQSKVTKPRGRGNGVGTRKGRTTSKSTENKNGRVKIECHKIKRAAGKDEQGNTIQKSSCVALNELDVIADGIRKIIEEYLNDIDNDRLRKDISLYEKEVELRLLEQTDLSDDRVALQSRLRKAKSRKATLRKELLAMQKEREQVHAELSKLRAEYEAEEKARKKLEQVHNFLTELELLRESVAAEQKNALDVESRHEKDGFEAILSSVTSHCSSLSLSLAPSELNQHAEGNLAVLKRFNDLLEACDRVVREGAIMEIGDEVG